MDIKQVQKNQAELKEILIKIIKDDSFYIHEVADLTYDIEGTNVEANVLSIRYDVTDKKIPELDRFEAAMDVVKEKFFKPF